MKSTRRQFLVQSVKAGLAVLAGVLGGLGLANRPRPTYEVLSRSGDDFWIGNPDLYEVPIDKGFTTEGWVRADGWDWDKDAPMTWQTRTINDEWVHVPLGNLHTDVFYPIGWEDTNVPDA